MLDHCHDNLENFTWAETHHPHLFVVIGDNSLRLIAAEQEHHDRGWCGCWVIGSIHIGAGTRDVG